MTDRGEHISTNNRFKIKQLCDNRKGSYTLTTLLLPSGYRHEGILDTGQPLQF
jgi:hypothetical protein